MVNHNPQNQFQKGNKHANGGGRKPGPSVFQKLLNEALIEAVTQLGEIRVVKEFNDDGNEVGRHYEWDGKDGLVGFFRFAAVHHTPSVIGLLGRILPFQLNVRSERMPGWKEVLDPVVARYRGKVHLFPRRRGLR